MLDKEIRDEKHKTRKRSVLAVAADQAIYSFKNATGKNPYSAFDITDSSEEPESLNERFGNPQNTTQEKDDIDNKFCPYCETSVAGDFEFCNNCGKKLP